MSRLHRLGGPCVALALLAVCGWSAGARAEEEPTGPFARIDAVVEAGLTKLGIEASEVRPRHDFVPSDGHRLALIDAWLDKPLPVARDADRRFRAWVEEPGSLTESLARAYAPLGWPASPPTRRPRVKVEDAVLALFGEADAPSAAEVKTALRPVPRKAREFLAILLDVLREAVALRTTAFTKLTEAEWVQLRKFGSQLNTGIPPHVQRQYLEGYHARIDVAGLGRAAERVAEALEGTGPLAAALPRRGKDFHVVWETPAGRVEVGGYGKNRYENDALLVLDLGGDDVHAHSAGGTLYLPHKVSVCVDLAGDDRYEYEKVGLAQGSGMYGVGVLVDAAGDDVYASKNVSQGAGHVGVGILWDLQGDDRYAAQRVSQGSGYLGVGLLRDDDGEDRYDVKFMGQGFGTTLGIGVLQDRAGNDRYVAGGLVADTGRDGDHFLSLAQGHGQGNRAGSLAHCTSGGIGLLADAAGDDHYEADVFGQGCAYWYAIGVLLDRKGDDAYRIYNYGQGGGFHMAVGVLQDYAGDDAYVGPHHAQGHALDRSVGVFVEHGGSDTYTAESEAHGSAVKPYAVAIFADLDGDDTYTKGTPAYVRVPPESYAGQWPTAFFMDLGGTDTYAPSLPEFEPEMEGEVGDGRTWVVNGHGYGTDR